MVQNGGWKVSKEETKRKVKRSSPQCRFLCRWHKLDVRKFLNWFGNLQVATLHGKFWNATEQFNRFQIITFYRKSRKLSGGVTRVAVYRTVLKLPCATFHTIEADYQDIESSWAFHDQTLQPFTTIKSPFPFLIPSISIYLCLFFNSNPSCRYNLLNLSQNIHRWQQIFAK